LPIVSDLVDKDACHANALHNLNLRPHLVAGHAVVEVPLLCSEPTLLDIFHRNALHLGIDGVCDVPQVRFEAHLTHGSLLEEGVV